MDESVNIGFLFYWIERCGQERSLGHCSVTFPVNYDRWSSSHRVMKLAGGRGCREGMMKQISSSEPITLMPVTGASPAPFSSPANIFRPHQPAPTTPAM